jgi:hypothetical protein
MLLPTSVDQVGFDMMLGMPELFMSMVAAGFTQQGAEDVQDMKAVPELDDIAEASVGMTALFTVEGAPLRTHLVVFRRSAAGAVVVVMSPDGQDPPVSVGDLARKLDARIVELLSSGQ